MRCGQGTNIMDLVHAVREPYILQDSCDPQGASSTCKACGHAVRHHSAFRREDLRTLARSPPVLTKASHTALQGLHATEHASVHRLNLSSAPGGLAGPPFPVVVHPSCGGRCALGRGPALYRRPAFSSRARCLAQRRLHRVP